MKQNNHNEPTDLIKKINPLFQALLAKENIATNDYFNHSLKNIYLPLCIHLCKQQQNKPLVIGINGAQGSGKSTLTKILSLIFEQGLNKSVASFSLDDLYKTKRERGLLAQNIHPLLASRGVPGTHDTELGISILAHLSNQLSTECLIPTFDKSTDDRNAVSKWTQINHTCDIIIFEGWCVGSVPQDNHDLAMPINELEKNEDPDKHWRRYVNQQLKDNYKQLFSFIDLLIMLKIPDFKKVYAWRNRQEEQLKKSIQDSSSANSHLMDAADIKKFIMHFERITRHTLKEMPARADIVLALNDNQQIDNIESRIPIQAD